MIPPTRRALLATTGTLAAGSLAGCLDLVSVGEDGDDAETYWRWLPSERFGWIRDRFTWPRFFVRSSALLEIDALSAHPFDAPAFSPLLRPEWFETATLSQREGYGQLAVDRATVEDSLDAERLAESGDARVYATGNGVFAAGDGHWGFVIAPAVGAKGDLAEQLVERVADPPDPGETPVEREGFAEPMRAVGAPSFVWLDGRLDGVQAYADCQRVVHGWDVAGDRTELRTAVGFPSADDRDPDGVAEWSTSDLAPDRAAYGDLSVSTAGPLVLVEGSAPTEDVTFFGLLDA
jgi:hypothetical protein